MALLLSTFLVQQFFWAAAVQFDAYFEEAAVKNNASWAKEESEIQQKLQKLESPPAQNDDWLVVSNIFYFPQYMGCHTSH